ncbi:MAG: hypothetical protein DRJ37_04875 [Thermoprotei archaeon]|nr:MAG: hypothetical protein DRJ37_04875 [Thermoprotei archaeon]
MKIIAVGGGKGGTGKTVLAVNLAYGLAEKGRRVLLVDLDVDNPCTYTFLDVKLRIIREVYTYKPKILEEKCTLCGECVKYCPVHALVLLPGRKLLFFPTLCESCLNCMVVCPEKAILEDKIVIGWVKRESMDSIDLIVGEIKPGERKTDEVISETLNYALESADNYDLVILDVPPGTGRGVYEALKQADLIVAVTEPTRLGLNDLRKFYKLLNMVKKESVIVINKYGLKKGVYGELEALIEKFKIGVFKVPYDKHLVEAYISGKIVLKVFPESPSARAIKEIVNKLATVQA